MTIITLKSLELTTFDKNNKQHLLFLKTLINDEMIKKRLQGISGSILHSYNNSIFGNSFFVQKNNEPIGYIKIGEFNKKENSVYLQGAISSIYRNQGYGKQMLNEINDYIFRNHQEVQCIILKISYDNSESLSTANSCGFTWLSNDYYIKYNPYLDIHIPFTFN